MNPFLDQIARSHGIVLPGVVDLMPQGFNTDYRLAMDAQPTLVTTTNAGIPAFLANYMDPKVIEVLTTPNKAAEILGEVKKGNWVTRTMTFSMVESAGETSSYGDWNNNGSTSVNTQFPQRQSYHYQTITQWGEKQLDEADLARIDYASRLNVASAIILDKFQNNTYFFGVSGLQNYGLLNDPSLPASIAAGTKAAGGTTWAVATANEIFTDVQSMYAQLASTASSGVITRTDKFVLAMSPGTEVFLLNTNSFGINVEDLIKKAFPNMRVVSAPQYGTAFGVNQVQLIAEEVEGQEAGYCSFTEKMRTHAIIRDLSAFKQKKSQGTWGCVIFLPLAFATMTGI